MPSSRDRELPTEAVEAVAESMFRDAPIAFRYLTGYERQHALREAHLALQAALPALRQQLYRELGEALVGPEALIAAVEAHGGSVIPHEEAMMRDALKAAWDVATGHSFDLGGEEK